MKSDHKESGIRARGVAGRVAPALVLLGMGIGSLSACRPSVPPKPVGTTVVIAAPLGLPTLHPPIDNQPTVQTIALGRKLFYDTRLSGNGTISCSSCHEPTLGFADDLPLSKGMNGTLGKRNAPTLLNAAYSSIQFWDGRADSLENQSAFPLADPLEMNQPHKVSVSKIQADPAMAKDFQTAFGPGKVTLRKVEMALASFERTLLSGNSAFDRYEYGGDKTALSPAAVRGMAVFLNPTGGNCAVCHSIGPKYALFTDSEFHNTGVGIAGDGTMTDTGRFVQTNADYDMGAFKTPTLRNVAITPPYMHDGSLKTLKDVVDFYAGGGNSNPHLDKEMSQVHLSGPDRLDLVEFLKSLTGDPPPNAGPPGRNDLK